jgi:hypothetical protein
LDRSDTASFSKSMSALRQIRNWYSSFLGSFETKLNSNIDAHKALLRRKAILKVATHDVLTGSKKIAGEESLARINAEISESMLVIKQLLQMRIGVHLPHLLAFS